MVTSVNPASLMVSWQLSPMTMESSQPITGHVVQYNMVGSSNVMSVNVTSGTTYTISGLVPCAEYEVTVATVSDEGKGPFSDRVVGISGDNGKINYYCFSSI